MWLGTHHVMNKQIHCRPRPIPLDRKSSTREQTAPCIWTGKAASVIRAPCRCSGLTASSSVLALRSVPVVSVESLRKTLLNPSQKISCGACLLDPLLPKKDRRTNYQFEQYLTTPKLKCSYMQTTNDKTVMLRLCGKLSALLPTLAQVCSYLAPLIRCARGLIAVWATSLPFASSTALAIRRAYLLFRIWWFASKPATPWKLPYFPSPV